MPKPSESSPTTIRAVQQTLPDDLDRLLITSDIHGHLQPLEAFDQLRAAMPGRSQVLFNGDVCYGGPFPAEAADWVRKNAGELATTGNHDELMFEAADAGQPPYTEAGAYECLSDEARDYFRTLPHRLELTWRQRRIVLMHGHVTADDSAVSWLATPDEQVSRFANPDADLCTFGHTHYPYVRQCDGTIYANSGSLSSTILATENRGVLRPQSGLSEIGPDEETRSTFLEVTEAGGQLQVEIVRFDFDRQALLDDMQQFGWPHMALSRRWIAEGVIELS